MLQNRFLFAFAGHTDKDHFGSDHIFNKLKGFFKQKLSLLLVFMFVGFKLNFFDCNAKQNKNLIEVVISPLKLLVIRLKNIHYFLVGSFALFAVLSDLLLREPDFFEVCRM
jgi:hypothetical protein